MYTVGTKLKLFVTHIKPESVWLKIWTQADVCNFDYIENELQKLEPFLEGAAVQQQSLIPHPGELNVGDICCAKFIEDEKWYRARIIDLSVVLSNKVGVKFIDYGNVEFVAISDIRKLDSPLLSLPPLASEFLLADVLANGTSWSDDALNYLKKNICYSNVVGIVVSCDGPVPKIRLSSTDLEIDCLSEYLIKQKFAIPATNKMDYSAHVLQVGKTYPAFIAQMNSLSKFWIHLSEDEFRLEEIKNELAGYFKSESPHTVKRIHLGMPCIARFSEDGEYYRAKVLKMVSDGFQVHFVDYGNTEVKQASQLWAISPSLLSFPPQAIECCLVESEQFSESSDVVDKFSSVTENKELECLVLSKNFNGPYVVDIKENNIKIIDHILENVPDNSRRMVYPSLDIQTGHAYEVTVSHVISLNKFYCQTAKSVKLLEVLMEDLQKSSSYPKTVPSVELREGLPCKIKCYGDNLWYRAKILELYHDSALISYVDYGNEETVDLKEIKQIETNFLSVLPMQAIKCNLMGLDDCGNDKVSEFFSLTRGKTLIMKVLCVKDKVFVDLYDMNVTPHIHINDILQKMNNSVTSLRVSISLPELNEIEQVYVTSVLTQKKFFAQLCKFSVDSLEEFNTVLNNRYKATSNRNYGLYTTGASHIGDFCCALFSEDETFYRGQVISESQSKAEIFFVDYGNSETKCISEVYKLYPEFKNLPRQGIVCKLPEEYFHVPDEDLKNLLTDATLEVKILKHLDNEYTIDLTDSLDNQTVKDKLKSCILQYTPQQPKKTFNTPNTYTDPIITGEIENIIVTHLVDPNNVWCQLQRSAAALLTLMDEIHCLSVANNQNLENPRVGLPCVAQFSDDGWYRALITKTTGRLIEVHFVDFGNSEEISLNKVKSIPDYCLSLPRQCIKCTLSGIPLKDDWDQSFVKEVENLLLEKTLCASFTMDSSDPKLYALTIEEPSHKQLVEEFVNKVTSRAPKPCTFLPPKFDDSGWEEDTPSYSENKLSNQSNNRFGKNGNNWKNTEPEDKRFGSNNPRKSGFPNQSFEKREKGFGSKPLNDFKSPKTFGDYPKKFTKSDQEEDKFSTLNSFNKPDFKKSKEFIKPMRNQFPSVNENNNQTILKSRKFTRKVSGGSEESFDASSDSTDNSMSTKRNLKEKMHKDGFGGFGKKPNQDFGDKSFSAFPDRKPQPTIEDSKEIWASEQSNTHLLTQNKTVLVSDKIKTFEYVNVDIGQFKDIVIVHVVSPSEFYCHLIEEAGKLNKLMNDLSAVYDNIGQNDFKLTSLKTSTPCCAKYYEDNSWYRAKVLTNLGQNVEVSFVDYGNTEILSVEHVKELKTEFLSLPAQALKCQLHNCRPVGDSWTPQNVKEFQKLILEKCFIVQIMNISPNRTLLVNLIDVGLDDVNINNKFIKSGHGKFTSTPTNLAVSEGLATYISPVISKGTKEAVQLSWFVNFGEFYCNILKNKPDLDNLMDKMQKYYYASQQNSLISNWCPGNPCVAKFSQDNVWYRAIMKEILGDSVRVEYVDFGNSEILPKFKINAIVPEFMMLPVQAIKCRLNGVRHSSVPSDVSMETCEKYLSEQALCNFLCHAKDIYLVEWLINGRSVTDEIIKDGLATPDDRPLEDILAEYKREVLDHYSISSVLGQSTFLASNVDWNESEYKDIILCDGGNPWKFWCYLASNEDKMKQIHTLLEKCYSNLTPNEMKLTNPKQGTACAVKSSTQENWHRGVVVDRLSPSRLSVFLIDCGLQEEIGINQAKILSPDLLQIPLLAFQCSLSNLPSDTAENKLSEEFASLTREKELVLQFVDDKNEWINVNLFDISDGLERNILEMLISKNKMEKNTDLQRFPPINFSWDLEEFKNIIVSGISFPEKFWCQLVSSAETIQKISSDLNEFYKAQEENPAINNLSVGMLCVAKSQNSESWHRAIIQKILSPSKLQVFYVDVGREDDVQIMMIRSISPEFVQIPVQAFPCCLKGHENIDSTDLYHQFDGIVSNTELLSKLENMKDGVFEVSLYMTTAEPINVLTELIGCKTTASSIPTAEIQWSIGEEREVTITGIGLPDQFWCQLLSSAESFAEFTKELSLKYESLLETEVEFSITDIGTPCVAWSSERQMWYRAIIQSQMSDTQFLVSFIDTGNWEKVEMGKIKRISPELLERPSEAFKCRLAGLPSRSAVSKMGYYFFDVIYEKKYFIAKLDSKIDNFYEVTLWYESQGRRYNVNEYVLARYKGESYPSPKATPYALPNRYKALQVQLGKSDGFVSHINSPNDFYIHLTSMEDELHLMSENLNDFFMQIKDDEMILKEPEVGHACCALYTQDDIWYRGEVITISDEEVSVRFIDYGNVDTVKQNKVKILPPEYLSNSVLAIRCTLPAVCQTLYGSEEGLENFQKLVLDKDLVIEFISNVEPCEVILYDAESGLPVIDVPKIDEHPASTVEEENTQSNICSSLENEMVSANQGLENLALDMAADSSSSEHAITGLQYNYLDLKAGQRYEVTVSHVVSPSQFWLQIKGNAHLLDDLYVMLNAEFVAQNDCESSLENIDIVSDMPCVALYSEDETWYRARVMAAEKDDVHVHFVDYGNSDTVKARNVRSLNREEIQIPILALECELCNVMTSEDDWTVDAIEEFENLVLEKTLLAEIVSQNNGKFSVHLLSMGFSVAKSLAENGFTELVEDSPLVNDVEDSPVVNDVEDSPLVNDTETEQTSQTESSSVEDDELNILQMKHNKFLKGFSDDYMNVCLNGQLEEMCYRGALMKAVDYCDFSSVDSVKEIEDTSELVSLPCYELHENCVSSNDCVEDNLGGVESNDFQCASAENTVNDLSEKILREEILESDVTVNVEVGNENTGVMSAKHQDSDSAGNDSDSLQASVEDTTEMDVTKTNFVAVEKSQDLDANERQSPDLA